MGIIQKSVDMGFVSECNSITRGPHPGTGPEVLSVVLPTRPSNK